MTPTRTTDTPSARDEVTQSVENDRRARLAGGEATRLAVVAEQEERAAKAARDAASDARIRGEHGADERWRAANARMAAAAEQRVLAVAASESASRVLQEAKSQLDATRIARLTELSADAEESIALCQAAAEGLRGPLTAYLAAWDAAATQWRHLSGAVRARVEAIDDERGFYRDANTVGKACVVPKCPVEQSVVGLLTRVQPRPPAMEPNYNPDPFSQGEPVTPEPPTLADGTPITFANNPDWRRDNPDLVKELAENAARKE